MSVNELRKNNLVAFSHRPQNGISVGVFVKDNVAWMAVGFVRDGDHFSRKLACNIITQRIVSALEGGKNIKFVTSRAVTGKVDTRSVVRELRKLFKPDPYCNDGTFANSFPADLGGYDIIVHRPMPRDTSLQMITEMFDQAIKKVSV